MSAKPLNSGGVLPNLESGYVLGRISAGTGAVEQIPVNDIATALKNQGPRNRWQIGFSFVGGVLSNSQILGLHAVAKTVTIPADFGSFANATSQAGGTANATGSTVITMKKNGSSVGTITIAAGTITPTFSTSGSPVKFAAGDVLELIGPGTADATFANFYCTIVGYES